MTLIVLAAVFLAVGIYHRIQSQRSGERLDRTREGWPLLIAIRLFGLLTMASSAALLWNPAWFPWAGLPLPLVVRWVGLAGFAFSIAWLIWMFRSLGRNLTDTVTTRQDAYFVEAGPYRYVRNPMYTGALAAGVSLGIALGTWLPPVGACMVFLLFALRTPTEERYLVERFGAQYVDYMRRVGRFFPRFG